MRLMCQHFVVIVAFYVGTPTLRILQGNNDTLSACVVEKWGKEVNEGNEAKHRSYIYRMTSTVLP